MADRAHDVAQALIKQRQIIVRIGVARVQSQRFVIVFERVRRIVLLVVQIAEIEMRQRVARIDCERFFVMLLRIAPGMTIKENCSQIDQRPRRMRIQFRGLLIRGDDFLKRRAGLLQIEALLKPAIGLQFVPQLAAIVGLFLPDSGNCSSLLSSSSAKSNNIWPEPGSSLCLPI